MKEIEIIHKELYKDLSILIENGQKQLSFYANSSLILVFWQVGKRINEDILQNKRAEYGKQIVPILSAQLERVYGKSFTEKNVRRMMQFAELFPDFEIVVTLSRQLSWSHFLVLIPIKKYDAMLFYAQLSQENNFGVRELRHQISRKAFERKEIANV